MPDSRLWHRISIVTPSFNQARFIEAIIQSMLRQDYLTLEYIVVNGDFTDGILDLERLKRQEFTEF